MRFRWLNTFGMDAVCIQKDKAPGNSSKSAIPYACGCHKKCPASVAADLPACEHYPISAISLLLFLSNCIAVIDMGAVTALCPCAVTCGGTSEIFHAQRHAEQGTGVFRNQNSGRASRHLSFSGCIFVAFYTIHLDK